MKDLLVPLLSPRRILQFTSIGIVGAIAETAVVLLLTAWGTADPLVAKLVGVEVSISLMFVLNDQHTFSDVGVPRWRNRVYRWGRSHIVRSGGIAVAFGVLWLLTTQTDIQLLYREANLWPSVANIAGIGVGLVLNYVAESVFTWEVHHA